MIRTLAKVDSPWARLSASPALELPCCSGIGSSITNILVILGLTMLAAPAGIGVSLDVLWIDLPLAAVVAAVCLPVFRSERQVSRREGLAFVGAYLVYMTTIVFVRA